MGFKSSEHIDERPISRFVLHFLSISIGICLSLSSLGQNAAAELPQYGFDRISLREGLKQNTVYSILEDGYGFIWLGTQHGLCRYDGQEFVTYGKEKLGGIQARVLTLDTAGVIWVGTDIGIARLDPCTEKSIVTTLPESVEVRSILANNGGGWIGTTDGLLHQDRTGAFVRAGLDSLEINGIIAAAENRIWAVTNEGLWKWENERWDFHPIPALTELESQFTCGLIKDRQIWLGNKQGEVFVIEESELINRFSINANEAISAISVDSKSRLWAGTQSRGVFLVDGGESRLLNHNLLNAHSLSHNQVLSLFQDSHGGMWVGTYAGGVNRYDPRKDIFWYEEEQKSSGLPFENNFYWAITEDRKPNQLFLGKKDGGVVSFDKNKKKYSSIPFYYIDKSLDTIEIKNPTVFSLCKDQNGKIWAGTEKNGLFLYVRGSKRKFLAYNGLYKNGKAQGVSVIKDMPERNLLVIATRPNGLYYLDYESGHLTEDTLFTNRKINCLLVDKEAPGVFWIGTEKHGLIRRSLVDNQVETFSNIKESIFSLCQVKGGDSLLLGTQGGGVFLVSKSNARLEPDTLLDQEGKIDVVYSIITDPRKKDQYWLTSISGVACYDLVKKTYDIIDYQYGLKGIEFNLGACLLSSDSLLYVGQGNNGLLAIDPRRFVPLPDTITQQLLFTSLWVNGKPIYTGKRKGSGKDNEILEKSLFCSDTLSLKFKNRYMVTHVSIPEYSLGDQVLYEAIIKSHSSFVEHEKDTVFAFDPRIRNRFSVPFGYSDVIFRKEGVFTLDVFAYYYGKQYKTKLGTITIIVQTPHWLRGWFIGFLSLVGLAILGLSVLAIRNRIRRNRIRELEKAVAEKTEDLKSVNDRLTEKTEVLKSVNERLSSKTVALEAQKQEQVARSEHLDALHYLINAVSRLETIDQIGKAAIKDMITFFGFDYVSFSVVDHHKRKIEVRYNDKSDNSIVDPTDWQGAHKKYSFKLSDTDILPKVVKQEDVFLVDGNVVNGEAINIDKSSILNEKVYYKYDHANLIRAFIPMKHRAYGANPEEKADYSIGVFEVGYHRSTGKEIEKQDIIDLKLYIDNCAQPFYRAAIREEDRKVQEKLDDFARTEGADDYLKQALSYLGELILADKGDFSFVPLDVTEDWFPSEPIVFVKKSESGEGTSQGENTFREELVRVRKKNEKLDKPRVGIYKWAIEKKEVYIADNVKEDDLYIKGLTKIHSQISIPLIYQGKAIGALSFYGEEKALFDNKKARVLEKYAQTLASNYIKKKIDNETRNLVKPFNVLSTREIYAPICEAIERYFQVDKVMAWQFEPSEEQGHFRLKYRTPGMKASLEEEGMSLEKIKLGNASDLNRIRFFDGNKIGNTFPDFAKFMKRQEFKSLISIPFLLEEIQIAVIVIFSKRETLWLLAEDRIFLNLIAQKGAMALQMSKMISSLETLSKAGVEYEQDLFLRQLVRAAADLFQADPVVLYPYEEGREIQFRDGVYAGTFKGEVIKQYYKGKHRNSTRAVFLANVIAKEGTKWFDDRTEYETFLKEKGGGQASSEFKGSFHEREKIQSFVGVQLQFEQKVVGVIFFNYRVQKIFSPETKRFIEAFAFLATNAIIIAKGISIVKKESEGHQEQAKFFKEAYYLRARGVNHDIRNNLLELGILKNEIEHTVYPELSKKLRGKFDRQFGNIKFNAKRIEELLNAFEITEVQPELIDMELILDESIQFFKIKEQQKREDSGKNQSIKIIKSFEEPFPDLFGDGRLFKMVVYNLFSNAIKAIEDSHSPQKQGLIELYNFSGQDKFVFMIKDNGTGIDAEVGNHIFEPYFGTREGGVGFGLYFVQEVLQKYFKGTIRFETKYGHWTKFFVEIPIK